MEKYLTECLNSIVKQSLYEKEIIIVNDGSTDNSLEIAKKYQEQYSYIKVFSQNNKGQSVARNFGISVAKGEYLCFVDADDYLNYDVIQDFYFLCKKYNLDMIRWRCNIYFENMRKTSYHEKCHGFKHIDRKMNSIDFFNTSIEIGNYEVYPILGLYKQDFLLRNQINFPEGITMEDHFFTLQCLTKNPHSLLIQSDCDLYTYRRRCNSTTTNRAIQSIIDIKKGAELMLSYINGQDFDEKTRKNAYKAVSSLISNIAYIYGRLSNEDKNKCIEIFPKEMLKFSIKHSINYRQKFVSILFTYFRFVVDIVYFIKLRIKPGI